MLYYHLISLVKEKEEPHMSKKKLRDFAPILLALLCAAVFGGPPPVAR